MLCNLYWWKRTSVHCNHSFFRRHRLFRLTKSWAWFISHLAGGGAAPSVLRMILICCIIMYWIWRVISGGPFRGPLYPLKPGVSRGPLGLSGGPGPLRPPRNSTTWKWELLLGPPETVNWCPVCTQEKSSWTGVSWGGDEMWPMILLMSRLPQKNESR